MSRALLCVVVASCALPSGEVVSLPPTAPVLADCETALARARIGDACSGITTCTSGPESCCTAAVRCASGLITTVTRDCSRCRTCSDDSQCPSGEWCIDNACLACPRATNCRPCLPPQVPLTRNGCQTCECGPPSDCASCSPNECLPSQYCQAGCSGPRCCVLQCAPPPCGPGVVGCAMPCGELSCAFCVALRCVCVPEGWRCDPVCAENAEPWASRCRVP